jgi:serine/threonine protein kinase
VPSARFSNCGSFFSRLPSPEVSAPAALTRQEKPADDDEASYRSGSGDEDDEDSDFEGLDGYRKGGYHPVHVGELYNSRYLVLRKLGWGHFSTVWLCEDRAWPGGRQVAMKVQKSAEHYTDAAYDEIDLLNTVSEQEEAVQRDVELELRLEVVNIVRESEGLPPLTLDDVPEDHAEADALLPPLPPGVVAPLYNPHVITLLDSFLHTGPHGKHMCMVFPVLGDNLLSLIKAYRYNGAPIDTVRRLIHHVCQGLDFLHRRCSIIHTDLKPENVLLSAKLPPLPKTPEELEGAVETEVELTAEEAAAEIERERLTARKLGLSYEGGASGEASGRGLLATSNAALDSALAFVAGHLLDEDVVVEAALEGTSGEARKKKRKKLRKRLADMLAADPALYDRSAEVSQAGHAILPALALTANFVALLVPTEDTAVRSATGRRLDEGAAAPLPPTAVAVLPGATLAAEMLSEVGSLRVPLLLAPGYLASVLGATGPSEGYRLSLPVPSAVAAATGSRQLEAVPATASAPAPQARTAPAPPSGGGGASKKAKKKAKARAAAAKAGVPPTLPPAGGAAEEEDGGDDEGEAPSSPTPASATVYLQRAAASSEWSWGKLSRVLRAAARAWIGSAAAEDADSASAAVGEVWEAVLPTGVSRLHALGALEASLPALALLALPSACDRSSQSVSSALVGVQLGSSAGAGLEATLGALSAAKAAAAASAPGHKLSVPLLWTAGAPSLPPFLPSPTAAPLALALRPLSARLSPWLPLDAAPSALPGAALLWAHARATTLAQLGWDAKLALPAAASDAASSTPIARRTRTVRTPRVLTDAEAAAAQARYASEWAAWEAQVASFDAYVVDLGNACWIHKHFSDDIQTRQYRAPEVLLGAGYDTSADVWSLAAMAFELLTGDLLFDPAASETYERDEDHMAQMQELLGPIPPKVALRGTNSSKYFNRAGTLRHISELRFWGPYNVLSQKYKFEHGNACMVEAFMLPCLEWSRTRRARALDCLQHPWFATVEDVQATGLAPGEWEGEGEAEEAGEGDKENRPEGGPSLPSAGGLRPSPGVERWVDWGAVPDLSDRIVDAYFAAHSHLHHNTDPHDPDSGEGDSLPEGEGGEGEEGDDRDAEGAEIEEAEMRERVPHVPTEEEEVEEEAYEGEFSEGEEGDEEGMGEEAYAQAEAALLAAGVDLTRLLGSNTGEEAEAYYSTLSPQQVELLNSVLTLWRGGADGGGGGHGHSHGGEECGGHGHGVHEDDGPEDDSAGSAGVGVRGSIASPTLSAQPEGNSSPERAPGLFSGLLPNGSDLLAYLGIGTAAQDSSGAEAEASETLDEEEYRGEAPAPAEGASILSGLMASLGLGGAAPAPAPVSM